nr:DUF3558 domain-containing protein [Saccharomonospora xinjiangensis]
MSHVLLATVLVVGCSSSVSGTPQVGQVGSSKPVTNGVPRELDLEPFLDRPCEIVPNESLDSIGYSNAGKVYSPESGSLDGQVAGMTGPSCGYRPKDDAQSHVLTVTLLGRSFTKGQDVLENGRRLHAEGEFELWEETSISGYSAAYWGLLDNRNMGDCSLMMKVASDAVVGISSSFYLENPSDACIHVETVAKEIVLSLSEAG